MILTIEQNAPASFPPSPQSFLPSTPPDLPFRRSVRPLLVPTTKLPYLLDLNRVLNLTIVLHNNGHILAQTRRDTCAKAPTCVRTSNVSRYVCNRRDLQEVHQARGILCRDRKSVV